MKLFWCYRPIWLYLLLHVLKYIVRLPSGPVAPERIWKWATRPARSTGNFFSCPPLFWLYKYN